MRAGSLAYYLILGSLVGVPASLAWGQQEAAPSSAHAIQNATDDALFFVGESQPAELIPIETVSPETPSDEQAKPRVDTTGMGTITLFRRGNETYEAEQFEEAIQYYEAILAEGIENGHVYFNLANAYFRTGDFGRAVLYFEKARRLAPRDHDIQHNLAYTRTFLIDKEMGTDSLPGSLETLLILHRQTNTRETLWILAALSALLGLLILVKQLRFKWGDRVLFGYLRGAVWLLFVLQLGSAGFKLWAEENLRYGVVLEDSVKATAAPASEEQLLELNSGTRVRLETIRNGYAQIRLPNGVPAFIKEGQIGVI